MDPILTERADVTAAKGSGVDRLTVPSFAKINLGLYVLGRRADGYHEIATVFQQIGLADELEVRVRPSRKPAVRIEVEPPILPADSRNLARRAAEQYLRESGVACSVEINLKKIIPMGAGLGGGSSNAAAVLLALDRLLGRPLQWPRLQKLALHLGADVPFFLEGGTALAEGIGDILTPLPEVLSQHWIVVVAPPVHISTRWAYESLKIRLTTFKKKINLSRFFLEGEGLPRWREELQNDFERVVFPAFPVLREIKHVLYEKGADYASLTGSGSAVYAIFHKEVDALAGIGYFQQHCPVFLVRSVRWGRTEMESNA